MTPNDRNATFACRVVAARDESDDDDVGRAMVSFTKKDDGDENESLRNAGVSFAYRNAALAALPYAPSSNVSPWSLETAMRHVRETTKEAVVFVALSAAAIAAALGNGGATHTTLAASTRAAPVFSKKEPPPSRRAISSIVSAFFRRAEDSRVTTCDTSVNESLFTPYTPTDVASVCSSNRAAA